MSLIDLKLSTSTRQTASGRPSACGLVELGLEALVEGACVAEEGQGVGAGEAHRLELAVDGALVERDRDERADERERQEGRALPEDDEHERDRGHDREGHRRPAHVAGGEREDGLAAASRDHEREQEDVHEVEGRRAERGGREQGRELASVHGLDDQPAAAAPQT